MKTEKSFMNLSKQECFEASISSLDNSKEQFNNAEILKDNKAYGLAISLLILSMEERIKGFVLHLDSQGFQFRNKVPGIKPIFDNHKLRYYSGLILSCFSILTSDLKMFIEYIKQNESEVRKIDFKSTSFLTKVHTYAMQKLLEIKLEIEWYAQVDFLRHDGFYVKYENILQSPQDLDLKMYESVRTRIEKVNQTIDELIHAYDITNLEWKDYLKEIQKDLIRKGWYNKLNVIVKKINSREIDFPDMLEGFTGVKDIMDDLESNVKNIDHKQ